MVTICEMPLGVMTGVGMPPSAMMRPCPEAGATLAAENDVRATTSKNDTKRPTKRTQLNHYSSSVTHLPSNQHPRVFCLKRFEGLTTVGRMSVPVWRQRGVMRRPESVRGYFAAVGWRKRSDPALLRLQCINCDFPARPKKAKQKRSRKCPTPSPATTSGSTSKKPGAETPIIFLHEFAADHTNWEPQMRHLSRGHRCIAYSARGYTPSDVPDTAAAYTYKHFYHRRARRARPPEDREGAFRRALDGGPTPRCRSAFMRRSAQCR